MMRADSTINADILLVTAHYDRYERGGRLASIGADLPSLSLLYLASYLREFGVKVGICDASALRYSLPDLLKVISEFNCRVLGISATTPSISRAGRLAQQVKSYFPDKIIVAGGPHATATGEETLKKIPWLDCLVIGEGEQTLLELLAKLDDKNTWKDIPGLVYRDNDTFRRTTPRELVKDIDDIPAPAWDLLDGFPERYHPAYFKTRLQPAAHIVTSRGCPFQCIFCDTSVFSRSVRYNSVEYVMDMLEILTKRFGIREVSFEDDTFTLNLKRAEAICREMIERRLNISWTCNARVQTMPPELLELFRETGCWQMAFGIESGCQEILDFSRKGTRLENIQLAIRQTRKVGIRTRGFFILGFPNETEKTLRRTLDFAKSLALDDISLSYMTPFPGSQMHRIAHQYGSLDDDWSKMTILEAVFVPHGLSEDILKKWYDRFIIAFYFRPKIILSHLLEALRNPRVGIQLLTSSIRLVFTMFRGLTR